jgi:class 3 adenylate cyclase
VAGVPNDLRAVLERRLGPKTRRVSALLRPLRRRDAATGDPELRALLDLLTVDSQALDREIAGFLEQTRGLGLPDDAVLIAVQAYSRAVGRIAAAEAEIADLLLDSAAPAERARVLDDLLGVLIPVSERGFSLLHEAMLHDALTRPKAPGPRDAMAVALVDVVGSTAHLVSAGDAEVERLVDALFEAGQTATAGRAVQPLKYVGDGVFLVGRDRGEVLAAALEALAHVEWLLPLPARAGLAYGSVVRRAGDLFGVPVNVAQLLSKAATAGSLLAERDACDALPAGAWATDRRVSLHPAIGEVSVTEISRR